MKKLMLFLSVLSISIFLVSCDEIEGFIDNPTVDCEVTPEAEECQVGCEVTPDSEECQVDCVENPDAEECSVNCEETPNDEECLYQSLVNEFLNEVQNYQDQVSSFNMMTITENIYTKVSTSDGEFLVETDLFSVTNIDYLNKQLDSVIIDENNHEYHVQIIEHNNRLVTIYATETEYEKTEVENVSFIMALQELGVMIDLNPAEIQDLEKTSDGIYKASYKVFDVYTAYEVDYFLGYEIPIKYDEDLLLEVEFDTREKDANEYKMKVSIVGLEVVLNGNLLDIETTSVYSKALYLDIEGIKPMNEIIEPAKSIHDYMYHYQVNDELFINQTSGDNFVAFYLEPGYYAVFNEWSLMPNNQYFFVYDENKVEFDFENYIHIEETTVIYLNYAAFGDWTNPKRFVSMREIIPLHQDATSMEELQGEITLDFTSENLKQLLSFPNATADGFMKIEVLEAGPQVMYEMMIDTRCAGVQKGDICASTTYTDADVSLRIETEYPDTITIKYQWFPFDHVSTDSNNPTPITEINNGASMENNDYYISFESTGADYKFELLNFSPGYGVGFTAVLMDNNNQVITTNWAGTETLPEGTYILKLTVNYSLSAVLPVISEVE